MNNARLLIVDDEDLNLKLMEAALAPEGYAMDFAGDGEQAWGRLEASSEGYDLVVLDRIMPVMDGIELLRRIKADPRFLHIPVVMQTAADSPAEIAEGLQCGAYYYLTKPYELSALQAIVRTAISDHRIRHVQAALARAVQATRNLLRHAEYRFRTLDEVHHLANWLAELCPSPDATRLGLTELMINAVEHGNLGIGYREKSQLKRENRWEAEVARRADLPEYRERWAGLRVEIAADAIVFTVSDEGDGFDWREYLEFRPERAFDPNGRGIAMASHLSFTSLEYHPPGNVVVARVKND